jgi:hypothetical protein
MLRTILFVSMLLLAGLTINQLIMLRRYNRERIEKIVVGKHTFLD